MSFSLRLLRLFIATFHLRGFALMHNLMVVYKFCCTIAYIYHLYIYSNNFMYHPLYSDRCKKHLVDLSIVCLQFFQVGIQRT